MKYERREKKGKKKFASRDLESYLVSLDSRASRDLLRKWRVTLIDKQRQQQKNIRYILFACLLGTCMRTVGGSLF